MSSHGSSSSRKRPQYSPDQIEAPQAKFGNTESDAAMTAGPETGGHAKQSRMSEENNETRHSQSHPHPSQMHTGNDPFQDAKRFAKMEDKQSHVIDHFEQLNQQSGQHEAPRPHQHQGHDVDMHHQSPPSRTANSPAPISHTLVKICHLAQKASTRPL